MTAVLLTGPAGSGDGLAGELQARGLRVHRVPAIETERVAMARPSDATYDWAVVTSATGAQALTEAFGPDLATRWAAVGPATSAVLEAAGVGQIKVPERANGPAIATVMGDVSGLRVLLARGDLADPDLPDRLRSLGATVEEIVAYRTLIGPETSREPLAQALDEPGLEVAVYASGSAVRGILALAGERAGEIRRLKSVTIGPRTSAIARSLDLQVVGEAASPAPVPLLEAILEVTRWQTS
jgi:uroporphyrinogen-III synthase